MVDVKLLGKALELGASETVRADQAEATWSIVEAIRGQGLPLVFEASGNPMAALQATKVEAANGVVVLLGMPADSVLKLDMAALSAKEAMAETVFRYLNLYPAAIKAAAAGAIALAKIASRVFPFDDRGRAFQHGSQGRGHQGRR